MSWLRALPLVWRLLTIAGVLAAILGAVGGIYAYVRHQGYVDGHAAAAAECAAERKRMEAANRNAINAANRRLIEIGDELALKQMQVDDYVKAIDLATAADPRGGDACLEPDSVRRLNAIR